LEVPKHFVSSKATIAGFSKGKYEINFFTTFSQLKPSKTKTGAAYTQSSSYPTLYQSHSLSPHSRNQTTSTPPSPPNTPQQLQYRLKCE
jgi:hypothetical protein